MQPWFIPMFYVSGAVLGGLALPRIEQAYFSAYALGLSVASAQALLSAAASGMMALTGIVFAMAFVMVQFSAIAYSPRLVLWFARDRMLFHALGAFTATFIYALFTIAWVDRDGSAKVPLFSTLLVGIMIITSMLLFARLMQRLGDLQIGNVLHLVGDQGRAVIGEMFRRLDDASVVPHPAKSAASRAPLGRVTQTVSILANPAPSPSSTSLLLSRWREFATLEWVDWFNNRRLLEPIGFIPPAEAEERYYAVTEQPAMAA